MSYYLRYNRDTNNLLDISTHEMLEIEGTVIENRAGDIPDFTKVDWNPAMLEFFNKTEDRNVSKVDFLNRFTIPERANIRVMSKQDPFVEDFLEMLKVAEFINLDDRTVTAALGYLEYVGLITPERTTEILS